MLVTDGEQFVMTFGPRVQQLSHVESWVSGTQQMVCSLVT